MSRPTPPHEPVAAPRVTATTPRLVSRRLLPGGLLASGGVAASAVDASASSGGLDGRAGTTRSTAPRQVPAKAGSVDTEQLLLRRFSYGLSPQLMSQVAKAGSANAWFQQQLNPAAIRDAGGTQVDSWYPDLKKSPQQLWNAYQATGSVTSVSFANDFVCYSLMKRLRSKRQVLEVMTEFWSNLLHVPAPNDKSWPQRADYDQTIRRYALTSFDQLLSAAVVHPAMLLYLDAYTSTKTAPNENLGRELLELHSVGRSANYTETDVLNSTRILTGWAVDRGKTWKGVYDSAGHSTGPVRVLSFTASNSAANGKATTLDYLSYLAHHPSTALRLAERLLVRFVSDTPSDRYVQDVAAAFTSSGTHIPTTLRAIVSHPEFVSGSSPKLRTPSEDYVATLRALQIDAKQPRRSKDLANYAVWSSSSIGQRPFDWPTPEGFPDANDAWASAARLLGSWGAHTFYAAGSYIGGSAPPLSYWLPPLPATMRQIVTTACQKLLFTDPTPEVTAAACASVGQKPTDVINAKHQFVAGHRITLLLPCLLDSPLHLNR